MFAPLLIFKFIFIITGTTGEKPERRKAGLSGKPERPGKPEPPGCIWLAGNIYFIAIVSVNRHKRVSIQLYPK